MADQRYTIQEQLGAGGNGAVFRAYDTQLKRRVAIKRLLSAAEANSADPNSEELRREADTLASLRNANIVTIFDVAQDAEGLFMVMELLEGPDLADAIAHGPLMYEDFKQLAEQTLEALLAAHNLRILHRDIKPENIKVERLAGGRMQAKIIDFGLARTGIAARKQTEDQEGSVMGSIYYMAPEQLSREPTDVRTDLYALGCVFYECLAGRKPFDGKTVNEVIDKHIDHDVVPLGNMCPHLPQWLTFWVMRLMSCKPDERPANAQQAIEEFRAWEKLPSMPGMMPWMPQGYGYAQPHYTAPVQLPVYTGQVPLHTTGYYPVGQPPHVTSSSVPVYVQPQSGSVPVPVAPQVQAPRPPQSRPTGPLTAKPPAAAKNQKMIFIGAGVAVVAVAAFFLTRGGSKSGGPGASAPSSLQIGPAREDLYPQERAFAQPDTALVFQVTAKVATHGYLPSGEPSPKIDEGSTISVWEDVSKLAGNTPLAAAGYAADASPERVAWSPSDHSIKDNRFALQFKSKSGKPVSMQMLNSGKTKDEFPFGQTVTKNPAGLTLAVAFQAEDKELPARLLKLASEDGKSSINFVLTDKRGLEVQLMGEQGVVKVNSSNIDTTKPCVAILTWDRATQDVKLRTRDQRGMTHAATTKAPPPSGPLYLLELGSAAADKATQFTGKLAEIILLSTAQKEDQSSLLEKDLREYYFNAPKPGALNPYKNQKLADFPVGEERDIFNGRDLTGWDGNSKFWSVKNGELTVKGIPETPYSGNCHITWKDGTVGDFELTLKVKTKGGANTGVFYRAFITGRGSDGFNVNGYQFDFDFGQKQRIGLLYESGVRNELAKVGDKTRVKDNSDSKKASFDRQEKAFPDAESMVKDLKSDQWNEIRIVAEGNHLQHFINGQQVADIIDEGHGRVKDGIIGFEWQVKNGSTAAFKDIHLKRLK